MELSYIFLKKVFLILWKTELCSPKNKNLQEGSCQARKIKKIHFEKISYISGNGTF